jgi:putative transposase
MTVRTSEEVEAGVILKYRYDGNAIQTDEHLHRCLVYIDLNMFRAGVVNIP